MLNQRRKATKHTKKRRKIRGQSANNRENEKYTSKGKTGKEGKGGGTKQATSLEKDKAEDGSKTDTRQSIAKNLRKQEAILGVIYAFFS